ncbi:hypothetical protein LWH94_18905 [Marinobacter sp. G11]|uniref:hypothetical protein n=1 Tax=Marinobacter sp. G11 TaxID=2903522 RepID=UPI001E4C21A1|nr:hypothetical protein [Marinobacter sp. G11]MCE0761238.1 hypothetical protein [Marinobacter sp. G11]
MKKFFASVYKKYIANMSAFDFQHNTGSDQSAAGEGSLPELKTFKDFDDEATLLGNAYRGIGVLVAILSAVIIFSAIAPTAFELHGGLYLALGITEVVAMALVIALVSYASKAKLRSKWRNRRAEAEKLRYKKFSELLSRAEADPSSENLTAVVQETLSHLSGENCQITYNRNKANAYHNIESLSNNIGGVGFGLALLGAVGHLVLHWNSLLILTVFVPAMVGAIHALNGFLKLSDLSDDHKKVATQLEMHKKVLEQNLKNRNDFYKLLETSRNIYTTLLARDEQWLEMVNRQNIQVV